jgi:SAM-dependent methyltransferase
MNVPSHSMDPVRELYERWPHPIQPTSLDNVRDRRQVPPGAAASSFNLFWPAREWTQDLDILHAGCGTTQAVQCALWDKQARITAIDISQASLDQTRCLADRYGLTNIDLHRLPLEEAQSLGREFDLIVCTGVLHHLADPDAGLRALRRVLRRDGAMFIMVYGRYGRLGAYMFQDYCRRLGLQPTESDLAELLRVLPLVPAEHPLAPIYRRWNDFSTANGLADALLHPRDRPFTVPEIYQWLDRCNLKLQRWTFQATYLPQCSALAFTPHLPRLQRLPASEQHAAVELFRGHLDKHYFVACRDDRPPESYEIDFAAPSWRELVPIPMHWLCAQPVSDKPGIAFRLICDVREAPPHDLLIAAPDVPLLQSLDGKRTLGQIAAQSNLPDADRRTLDLYRNLWDHDLVMFRKG